MKTTIDLSKLEWTVSGWSPYAWMASKAMETGVTCRPEVPPVPATVPGSVQNALLSAGILPDWNVGEQARDCEWVENRHWAFEAKLPALNIQGASSVVLRCLGLDYSGWLLVNGAMVSRFRGSLVPHEFDLRSHLSSSDNRLTIVYDVPPRWLGQTGFTSEMTDWKPRYNYTWDWTSRLVQIGIWDDIKIEVSDAPVIDDLEVRALLGGDLSEGSVWVRAEMPDSEGYRASIGVYDADTPIAKTVIDAAQMRAGVQLGGFDVESWYPNGLGAQKLYRVEVKLISRAGEIIDTAERRVGFKNIIWQANDDAPEGADPWICVVNGYPVFLQGINWTPILPNFADVSDDMYLKLLRQYKDIGCNLLRVWGGAFLEKQIFYDICDELGLMVWQEFPLSSSGLDNWPPDDDNSIGEMELIARSYISRRAHHVSILLWCGGNELQTAIDGNRQGIGKPVDASHPMLARLQRIVAEDDPDRRFLATSASGPRFMAFEPDFGKGIHWDVHGPWCLDGELADWHRYWNTDDSLFRSETGCPGASGADLIREYAGQFAVVPGTLDNPLWRRSSWWIEWHVFIAEMGRDPDDLEEYVAWSQARQATALEIAVRACKARFGRCGGILLWMGHDSFPCTANTSIIDFWRRLKPAAEAVARVFRDVSADRLAGALEEADSSSKAPIR
ncbi:MAG TPA: hypothetical protein VGK19_22715 [Capsulimonadaceae bacterium]